MRAMRPLMPSKRVEYIKGTEGIGAPKPKRQRSIHSGALEWIRDHPVEFKLHAGKWAAVTGSGIYVVGDSEEDVWKKLQQDELAPENPLVIFIPSMSVA